MMPLFAVAHLRRCTGSTWRLASSDLRTPLGGPAGCRVDADAEALADTTGEAAEQPARIIKPATAPITRALRAIFTPVRCSMLPCEWV